MKITMYELLGLVKDGKAPKRILYDNYIWSWTGDDYQTILKDEKEQFLITGMYYTWLTEFLSYTVEIIEEEKKIPEKIPLNYADDRKPEEVYEYLRCSYNQLIDYLKSKGE